eukprot:138000-Pyramimonas_sp.AAC.1
MEGGRFKRTDCQSFSNQGLRAKARWQDALLERAGRRTQPSAVVSNAVVSIVFGGVPLWGHEACRDCTNMCAAGACERSHWGLR